MDGKHGDRVFHALVGMSTTYLGRHLSLFSKRFAAWDFSLVNLIRVTNRWLILAPPYIYVCLNEIDTSRVKVNEWTRLSHTRTGRLLMMEEDKLARTWSPPLPFVGGSNLRRSKDSASDCRSSLFLLFFPHQKVRKRETTFRNVEDVPFLGFWFDSGPFDSRAWLGLHSRLIKTIQLTCPMTGLGNESWQRQPTRVSLKGMASETSP